MLFAALLNIAKLISALFTADDAASAGLFSLAVYAAYDGRSVARPSSAAVGADTADADIKKTFRGCAAKVHKVGECQMLRRRETKAVTGVINAVALTYQLTTAPALFLIVDIAYEILLFFFLLIGA